MASTSNLNTGYLYRGERFDTDLGQYYLRARFYNQSTGRFWNQDTYEGSVGDPISLHKYLYAHAEPITGFDPSGHMSLLEVFLVSNTVGTLAGMSIVSIVTGDSDYVVEAIPVFGGIYSAAGNFRAGNVGTGIFDLAIAVADAVSGKIVGAAAAKLAKGKKLVPGVRGKVTGGSSATLRQNLGGGSGGQAHHLIPVQLRDHPLLKRMGMELDHASNGIILGTEIHSGFHSIYNRAVRQVLDNIEARNLPLAQLEQQIFKLQRRLENVIDAGMPLYKNAGATVDDWVDILMR